MGTQRYEDWSLGLHKRVVGRRIPIEGSIEVTRRCNHRCVHCYNNLPLGDQEARRSELTYEEHCRILDEITGAGCLWLLYTGGEIFARKDFLDIYTYAKQKGLLITLFTNGTLITPEVADYLVQWRPFSIEISLYGRTKEAHEQITDIPGSYDQCMRGIRLLMERGLPLQLKTMALTLNKDEIWDMKRFVEEDLGLEFKFDAMINCRIDCSQGPLALRLAPEEVVALDLQDSKRVEEWKRFADQFDGPTHFTEHVDELYHCGGGINSFAIDPSGMLSACVLSRGDTYDLRKGSFQEGWENFLLKVRQKKITRQTKCVACEIKATCGMCPANGELESGDAEEPVDFLCQLAHLRAHALGLPVPQHGDCEYCQKSVLSPQHLFTDVSTELLRSGQSIRFRAPGRSMYPTIKEDETITVQPVAPSGIKMGDIILYRLEGVVIAHRVVRIERGEDGGSRFILRGDASGALDEPVEPAQVLGKVVSVERGSRSIDLYSRSAKMLRTAYVWASRLKRWMIRME